MIENIGFPGSLHCHTEFSNFRLKDCIIKVEDLIKGAKSLGHSVVAITDHETIASAVIIDEEITKAKKNNENIKIIRGNEIYLCRTGLNNENFISGEDKYFHFILLAKDLIGFYQLCELSTRAWSRSYISTGNMRRVPTYYQDLIEVIGGNPGHVIGATACLGGFLPTKILRYRQTEDEELLNKNLTWCKSMEELFGKGNFYLELQPSNSVEQTYVNKELIRYSNLLDIPYIITCDAHYLYKEDREIHKAYLNSADGEREVDSFYETTYLMTTEQVEENCSLTKEELQKAYQNILEISNKCEDYSILKPLKIPSLKWNEYKTTEEEVKSYYDKIPMLKTFWESDFVGDKELCKAVIEGIKRHEELQCGEAYIALNSNLNITWKSSVVNNAHWSSYFLNLQKIIELCWEAGSLVGPGRGSGVGFLLLYCLDITQINPLRENTTTFEWRFLNPDRVSVLDVDFDTEGRRRPQILNKFRECFGEDRVANVATYRTETSKAAIATSCRGLGIDVDTAHYLTSLIPSDRGAIRTLSEVFYGDEEKDMKPVPAFVQAMTNEYPQVWEVAKKIEGLICGYGVHAGGVIFVDEPFTNSTALMKSNDLMITQFELHAAEKVSLIKYDSLSVECMDKLHICLDLLAEDGRIERCSTLKETYEKYIGIYNLDRTSKRMWEMVWNHEILSLFQMEQQSGIQGIALTKPNSVDELATLNSVIRLMAQEKGGETPLEKYARYKNNPNLWYEEMARYGLTAEEIQVLEPIVGLSFGICEAQEKFMMLVQIPECGGMSLGWADQLRKAIAKKNPKAFEELEREYYDNIKEKNLSFNLCNYVWKVLVSMSRGYGFNLSHTLAYSLVALQEMNLAYRYPSIYWNCACLISNAGSAEEDGSTDYVKTAIALGESISQGIKISLININSSSDNFIPDAENNQIQFGLRALSGVGSEEIQKIKEGRPYLSFKDFLKRCKLTKPAMFSLIKAGAFDNLEVAAAAELKIEPRELIMTYYLKHISDAKSELNLRNFNSLINSDLIPDELKKEKDIFRFDKYLKKNKYLGYYFLDSSALPFYEQYFDMDLLYIIEGVPCIKQSVWDKMYSKSMDTARAWMKGNQQSLLKAYNTLLFLDKKKTYGMGNISSWEMDALCFYYHDHELANIDTDKYGIVEYKDLPKVPTVEKTFKKNGKEIPIYNTYKIIGTVIGKDDNKATFSLLTPKSGVVTVKMTKEYYAMFKKQISEKQEDGTKKVIEKGWFKRGTKLMLTGFRRGDQFVTKTYAHTPTHQIYYISNVYDNGTKMEVTHERYDAQEI